ncbi:MAG: hypothetical protein WCK34_07820 [Bacteroidota bacterium]
MEEKEKQKKDSLDKVKVENFKKEKIIKDSLSNIINLEFTKIETKTKSTITGQFNSIQVITYYIPNLPENPTKVYKQVIKNKIELFCLTNFKASDRDILEVFFLNKKISIPKFGYNYDSKRTGNQWGEEYNKYVVGYFTMGNGDKGTLSDSY